MDKNTQSRRSASQVASRVFDVSPDSIFIVNRQGEVVAANAEAERTFGYTAAELTGKPIELLLPNASRESHVAYRERFWNKPERRPLAMGLDFEASKKNGDLVQVEVSLCPYQVGKKDFALAFVRDISRRKKAEANLKEKNEHLQRLNEDLEKLVYAASHDLLEPIRSSIVATQLFKKNYPNADDDASSYLEQMIEETTRAKRMVDALGEYYKLRHDMNMLVETDLNEISKDLLHHDFSHYTALEGAKVSIGELPKIRCVMGHARKLMFHLFDNAFKFSGHKPIEIQVTAPPRSSEHCITFSDSGIGIREEHREKIFDVFRQVHGHRKYPGVGMGLAIAKKIVTNHGGRIWAESSAKGGAKVSFTLPR